LQPLLVTHPNNLPDEPTPFIGREREIDQIAGLLRDPRIRMVTLTGPGGTGKTRLALQVGTTVLPDFRDGVFFVDLAPLTDPALVASAVAEVLGVKEAADRTLLDALVHHLTEKHLLLVLDNYEHLLDASPVTATLLDECRELHILVTSRIPLHLSREHEYAVPPLSVPDLMHLPTVASLSQYESVALFINRARAVKANFEVTNDTAPAVAEICSRLDGLPLAIELAAARIKLFPPLALLQRLNHRLKLLTGGARDRPTRQQTLRNTIDWSYSLLTQPEQTLFARLSVFAGGCTLEAAEAVRGQEGEIEIVDGVTSLLEQNLLREMAEDEPRFAMLETIREYAKERLEAGDEAEGVRERHGAFYLRLAEEAESELGGPQQVRWLNRLESEHDNLRAALGWMLVEQRAEEGLRLAGALWRFWLNHGHFSEGRRWLERALAVAGGGSSAVRAKALNGAGNLAFAQGDYERTTTLHDESLTLRRELGDARGIAGSLMNLGNVAFAQGDYEHATTLYDESLTLFRELGDTGGIAGSLSNLGLVARIQGDYERATALHDESLTLLRELGDTGSIAYSLLNLGIVARNQGDYERATVLYDEGQALVRELGDTGNIAFSLMNLGTVARDQGDYERATALYDEGLTLLRELGDADGIAKSLNNLGIVAFVQEEYERATTLCRESLVLARELGNNHLAVESLEPLGDVAAARHEPERAARLWGAADAWRGANGVPLPPVERQRHERMIAEARQQLDEATWTAAWEEGRAMSLEQTIQYALGESSTRFGHPVAPEVSL
jgi:predicted ATPase